MREKTYRFLAQTSKEHPFIYLIIFRFGSLILMFIFAGMGIAKILEIFTPLSAPQRIMAALLGSISAMTAYALNNFWNKFAGWERDQESAETLDKLNDI